MFLLPLPKDMGVMEESLCPLPVLEGGLQVTSTPLRQCMRPLVGRPKEGWADRQMLGRARVHWDPVLWAMPSPGEGAPGTPACSLPASLEMGDSSRRTHLAFSAGPPAAPALTRRALVGPVPGSPGNN